MSKAASHRLGAFGKSIYYRLVSNGRHGRGAGSHDYEIDVINIQIDVINIYIYNRIEQCALPVTTIMALWQLVNLGTRCTVTHCRIALWSHRSAQTASSERCIMQIVNVSLRDSPPNP